MKILSKYISASTQIHNGKCYFIGLTAQSGKESKAHNIEGSGTAAVGNMVGWAHSGGTVILPKPGVECSNGLYVTVQSVCLVYYSIG